MVCERDREDRRRRSWSESVLPPSLPGLLHIYMDELSYEINRCNIGSSLNGTLINHIMYADSTCIIASSPSAMQRLLTICADFADSNFVLFNGTKLYAYI